MNLQTNVGYIDGLSFKLDWHRDKNGNIRTLPFKNEKYTINPTNHQVQLKRIPAENSAIKIELSLSRMGGVTVPLEFIEVSVITQANHFIFDRENNIIQFHSNMIGDVLIDYEAIGQFVLDANSIATAYDSRGNVLEYLSDLIKSCNNALANVVVIGELSDAIEQIKAYIESSTKLNKELSVNLGLARIESASLKSQIPLAQITNTQLREALLEAQDDINKIEQTGGKTISITSSMWGERQLDGFYKYTYTHNLGTKAIDISGYMLNDERLWVANGKNIDNNTFELWNETNDGVVVNIFARAFKGTVTSLSGFNTDDLTESTNRRYLNKQNSIDLDNNTKDVNLLKTQVGNSVQEIVDLKSNKVDKVMGKGLSTFDYNQSEKDKNTNALSKSTEALEKAQNPLNALMSAGYKVKPNECSEELLNLINGNATINIGQGLLVNQNEEYPLVRVTINGVLDDTMNSNVKKAILDAQVINANPNKVYQIAWLGNGYTGFGENAKYGIQIFSYDKATVSTSIASKVECVGYGDVNFSQPSGVVTRTLNSKVGNEIFVITVDYSALVGVQFISTNTFGNNIIHNSKYILTQSNRKDLSANKGSIYPFFKFIDGSTDPKQDLINAILDVKILNAKPNKIYKIEWLGNNNPTFKYSIFINEYDETDITLSKPRVIFDNKYGVVPVTTSNINTFTITRDNEDVAAQFTIDYSKLTLDRYPMNANGSFGYGHIIDKSCYYVNNKPSANIPNLDNNYTSFVNFKYSQDIDVKIPYGINKSLVLNFNKLGINKITHIKKVSYINESKVTRDFSNQVLMYDVFSDWLSPYGMKALNNVPSEEGYGGAFTVGGNHGTDNATGFPTSNSISTQVFVDGNEIFKSEIGGTDNIVGAKNCIEIITKNFVYASNVVNKLNGNKRNSVIETVLYRIHKDTIFVTVELEALEDVYLNRYTGFQLTAPPVDLQDRLYFMTENTFNEYRPSEYVGREILSCKKSEGELDRFIWHGENDAIICYRDKNVGISDLRHLNADENVIYKSTSTKCYMHNISQKNPATVYLNRGQSIYWGGGYTFTSTGLKCDGVKKAYTIRERDKRVYCIDFDKATSDTYLEPYVEDRGKFIKVLSKSNSVTCDNFITSKGLKVSSTSFGQLKFIIE